MLKKWMTRTLLFGLLLAALAQIAPAIAQTGITPANQGSLRIVNGLVGLGNVDVYLDGERVAFNLPARVATPYLVIPAGKHAIAVRPPEADPLSSPIADYLVDLSPNASLTAVAYQRRFASGDDTPPAAQAGSFYIMADDRSALTTGRTRLMVAHLAPGAPPLLNVAYPSRASLLHQVRFEQPYGSIDVDAGIYSLTLVNADSAGLDILARLGDQIFYANTLYTLVIVPDVQPPARRADDPFVAGPGSSQPTAFAVSAPLEPPPDGIGLRLIHAAHDTAVVDVYIDERLVAPRMNYGRATEYLGLKDYSHTITLRRAASAPDSAPLARATFAITLANQRQVRWTLLLLNADGFTTAPETGLPVNQPDGGMQTAPTAIVNTPGGSLFMALLPDDISQTRQGFARVRLVNAISSVPALQLFTPRLPPLPLPPNVTPTAPPPPRPNVTPTPEPPVELASAALFAAEASAAETRAGLYERLDFLPAGTTNRLLSLPNVQMASGMVYTFVMMGSPVGNPPVSVVQFADYGAGLPLDRLYVGVVNAASGNVRANPNANSAVVGRLTAQTEVEVLGRNLSGEWVRIRFADPASGATREGWISATIITVTRLGVRINVLTLPRYAAPGG